MAILAAPYLEEKLPAQQGDTFSIPFSLNRIVGNSDINSIQLKIKTISTNITKALVDSFSFTIGKNSQGVAIFKIPSDITFEVGQHYKAQIAIINKGDIGDFSQVGVFKYTKIKSLKILDSVTQKELEQFSCNSGSFVGEFISEDITEKVESYKFDIYDMDDKICYSTDFIQHDTSNDKTSYLSIDYFTLLKELKEGINYSIVYSIKTVGNVNMSTLKYYFTIQPSSSVPFPGSLKVISDTENGYFSLLIHFNENKKFTGSFRLLRSDNSTNFSEWQILKYFTFNNKNISINDNLEIFKDYTIEQGKLYKYAIQQYSNGNNFISRKLFFNTEIINGEDVVRESFNINFEDIFLYDGERQLKIKFNPKISSFKNTILENKIDTIGSKYPFFFRNGAVCYKEFPIAGLISCAMDENSLFFKDVYNDSRLERDNYTDLTYNNILYERDFKLEVLDWLSNGEVKLFRSATEGNYLIRLMNVNLSPLDTLGRMLHSFSASAYECADYTFDNIQHYILSDSMKPIEYKDIKYEVLNLSPNNVFKLPEALFARIVNAKPYSEVSLIFKNQTSSIPITIGYTGEYNININQENPLIGLEIKGNSQGQLEYAYYDSTSNDNIYDSEGNIINNFKIDNFINQYTGNENGTDLLKQILSSKEEYLEDIPYLRLVSKISEDCWYKSGSLYNNYFCEGEPIKLLSTSIYHAINTDTYYIVNDKKQLVSVVKDLSYQIGKDSFVLNSGRIEMSLDNVKQIDRLWIGNGLIADIFYRKSSYKRSE